MHPVCRNCQKSKRECLGYDPIFKQQSGPQALQPAPGNSNNNTTASASPTPSTATSGAGAYSPAQASHPPQPQSAAYPPTPQNHPAPSPTQSRGPYESGGAIDPALAGSPKVERKHSELKGPLLPPPDGMDSPKMKPGTE